MTHRPPRVRATLLAVSAALALSGCSGGEEGDAAEPTPTPTATPSSTVASADGVELTLPGSQLAFGDTAVVAHGSGPGQAVLEITVESAKQGTKSDFVGFDLDDPYKKRGNFYYVRVAVRNAGKTPAPSQGVPLLGISGDNTLLQPVEFTSSFSRCPTEKLPRGFKPKARFETCLVFLSPERGELEGLSYRPAAEDVPIEWRGEVTPAQDRKPSAG